jgi:enoyl-CoA hydratase
MISTLVRYQLTGPVAVVTMDDGKANVMSVAMQEQLHQALDCAEGDGAVVVLGGREGTFSAGFDLRVLAGTGREKLDMVIGGFRLAERLFSFPRPVIMACTGHAIAMGVFLLLSGDFRVGAAGTYRLGANEVALGMNVPHAGIEIMRHRLAPAALDRAVVLAEEFCGDKAVACGMLDELAEPADVFGVAVNIASRIAALDLEAHRVSKLRTRAAAIAALHQAIADDEKDLAARLDLS